MDRETGKSKGFGYVDFESKVSMKDIRRAVPLDVAMIY